jgi:hypothetical protein
VVLTEVYNAGFTVYEIRLVKMQEKTDSTFLARAGFVSDATSMTAVMLKNKTVRPLCMTHLTSPGSWNGL